MDETPRVKLKRLQINRYRTIKPGTELHFSEGMNVLLGKNGTGKTTLLNLLAMVVGGNFYEAREEELDLDFELGYAESSEKLAVKISNQIDAGHSEAKKSIHQSFKVYFKIIYRSDEPGSQSFTIENQQNALSSIKITVNETPYNLEPSSRHNPFNENQFNFISNILVMTEKIDFRLFFHELPRFTHRLDEARDWLGTALRPDDLLISLPRSTKPHYIYELNLLSPPDMISSFLSIFAKDQTVIAMIADVQSIPSLQRIVDALGYVKGQVIIEQLKSDKKSVTFGNPRFHFTKRDGTSVRLEQLSFGEQRLFAFYYYLACTSQMVIADELTNGLHHEMISGCIAAIGDRQAFLATQNPLLLDHLEFKSIDEVRASFILCSKETSDGQEWMSMRQLGEDEGREFFGHYQVELKQVNAILRWLGLW